MRHVSRCTARREVFSADLKLSILRVESRRESGDEFQVNDPQRRTLDDQTAAWYDQLTTIGWQQTLTAGSIRCSIVHQVRTVEASIHGESEFILDMLWMSDDLVKRWRCCVQRTLIRSPIQRRTMTWSPHLQATTMPLILVSVLLSVCRRVSTTVHCPTASTQCFIDCLDSSLDLTVWYI